MRIDQKTAREAVYAVLTLLDGTQDPDIQADTGLTPERCQEIAALRARLFKQFGQDWMGSA